MEIRRGLNFALTASSQYNNTKKKLRQPDWKERSKLFLFANDMVLCLEKPKESTSFPKPIRTSNEFVMRGIIQDQYTKVNYISIY